jgi:hypothetical protein
MTNVFAVVGEHRDQPTRLLLIGDDGQFYSYASDAGSRLSAVEPTDDWSIDDDALEALNLRQRRRAES